MVSTALREVLLLMHYHSTNHCMLGQHYGPYKRYQCKATGKTIRVCIFSVPLPS